MNRHLAIKMPCFRVVKRRNSPAITCAPRLESEPLNQRFPGKKTFMDYINDAKSRITEVDIDAAEQ